VIQPLLPPGPLAPIRQYPADGNDTVMLAWPPDKPAEAGNDDGAVTPGGGVRVSATDPFTAASSTSPPVSAARLIVTERPGLVTPTSVKMPPVPWKPIVSAGATGTAGGASGAWLKLNAENRLF